MATRKKVGRKRGSSKVLLFQTATTATSLCARACSLRSGTADGEVRTSVPVARRNGGDGRVDGLPYVGAQPSARRRLDALRQRRLHDHLRRRLRCRTRSVREIPPF